MMDCARYRRSILADPRNPDPDMGLHLASCADCTRFTERLQRFEGRLEKALHVSAQAAKPVVLPWRARTRTAALPRRRRRWLAAAASVLLGVVIGGTLWVGAPGRSLAADVVGHMVEEPDAWARTEVPVQQSKLDRVLNEAHVRLKPTAGLVSYANSCLFRGRDVPHLVLQTSAGPVTVMMLRHEPVRSRVRFDEGGYRGVIVPVPGHGSLAVLERGRSMDIENVEGVAARVLSAIDWIQ
ncbi:MAG: hypothetical protein JWN43_4179 [Gammaproteobacteria bacterium]|nr:hypothetical protein [Gammaproteobacteria bacterium]